MPKINVYLPDDLATAVRAAGIPMSAVCQQALADAVAAVDGPPRNTEGGTAELARLTKRARTAMEHARTAAAVQRRSPSTVDLVDGLIAEGANLALAILRSLDLEPSDLAAELHALSRGRRRSTLSAGDLADVGVRAAAQAAALGQDYVGCEHLLLGLAAGPEDELVAATLHAMGVELDTAVRAVTTALAGYAYAREHLSFSGLSAPIRSTLEEIRQRLARLETRG